MLIARLSPAAPLYSTLGDVRIILDATGLRDNINNDYGQVTAGVAQTWKSISPGITTYDFGADVVGTAGTKSTLKYQDGYIEFPGQVTMLSQDVVNDFEQMSFASPVGNLKNTIHMVLKIAQEDIPAFYYGLYGTNALSAGNKGSSTLYEDSPQITRSDGLTSTISKGTAGFIIQNVPDNLIVPNVPFVYTEETDMSQAAADRRKHYINGVLFAYTGVSASTAVASVPSFVLEIGGNGNNVAPLRGWISHFIWQTRIESSGVRAAFINSLLPFASKSYSNYFYEVDEARVYTVTNTFATAGRYYFVQGLILSSITSNKVIQIYHNGNQHLYDVDKRVSGRISSDGGRTWAAEVTIYDDDGAGVYAVQDGEWGIETGGRIHGITDWHTAIGTAGGTHKLLYHYTDDDFGNLTTIDITSIVPADTLVAFRAHGNIVEGGDGFLYGLLYKTTEENDGTQTAQYILRKPVGASTTWTALTLKAPGASSINESSIQPLDSTTLLILSRNNTTGEWNQYIATSNGTSVTDQGAITFGETRTTGSPPLLTKFRIRGTDVIAAWILDKDSATKTVKVIYGTCANLLASGLTGWDLDTKFTAYSGTPIIHYGRVLHKTNTLNAIGAWALEPNPPTLTENSLISVHMPATQYFVTKTELGL